MRPRIIFKEKDGKLLISIAIHGQGRASLYETGITVSQWSEENETCEDYEINKWMRTTRDTLLKSFRPDMNAKRLWTSFINVQSETTATIRQAFDYYLSNMNLKPNSKSVYISVGNTLQHAGLFDTPLTEVTPALIRGFINGLKTAPSSKFNTLTRVQSAMTRYIKDHQLNISIDLEGIARKPKYVAKPEEWLTGEQVETLWNSKLEWATKDARDLFVLCCYTGMSASDAIAFDPKKNVKEINGRDFIDYTRIKTDSNCKVPIIAQTKAIIESRQWPVRINLRTYQYQVNKLGELIGKKMNTHLGRKTFGCLFLEYGFSIETVSKLMGHSNTNLTSKVYSKVTQQKIERELMEIGI